MSDMVSVEFPGGPQLNNNAGQGILLANFAPSALTMNGFYLATLPPANAFASLLVSGTAGAVPESATWAMMILGRGAVGFAMRRRSKNVTTTVAYAA